MTYLEYACLSVAVAAVLGHLMAYAIRRLKHGR